MKILVTGAKGFVGRNLCENLKAVRDGAPPCRSRTCLSMTSTRPPQSWTTFVHKPILCSI